MRKHLVVFKKKTRSFILSKQKIYVIVYAYYQDNMVIGIRTKPETSNSII